MQRFWFAIRCFFTILFDPAFYEKALQLQAPVIEEKKEAPKISFEAVQLLTVLQREGRLVDFLREDIQGYADAQIGAAVRSVHAGCRKAIDEYFKFEPILPETEGSPVQVPAGFDPSAIRLAGEFSGQPPYRGTLQHHGWRVKSGLLPTLPPGQDRSVVAPAEVEIR